MSRTFGADLGEGSTACTGKRTLGQSCFVAAVRSPVHRTHKCLAAGFTLVELMIAMCIIMILAAAAMAFLTRAKISANEAAAMGWLRSLHSAQTSFAASCGRGGYAQSLEDLAKAPLDGGPAFFAAAPSTTGGMASGYVGAAFAAAGATDVAAGGQTCNGSSSAAVSAFVAERHPVVVGLTGLRSFGVDQSGTIFFRADGASIPPDLDGTQALRD